MRERVLLFAKVPRPGEVKTRLADAIGADRALSLYEAFLEDQLRFLRSLAAPARESVVCSDASWPPTWERRIRAAGASVASQGPGDLGNRLLRAFVRSARAGIGATVALGVDSPTLPRRHVLEAFRLLRAGAAAVVSPAADGGFVLLGLARPEPDLLREVPWGTSRVLDATRARAHEAGVVLAEIEGWYDVDEAAGLARLQRELRDRRTAQRAPATARCLLRCLDGPEATMV